MNPQLAAAFHCPKWKELPAVDLYMDQVVLLLNQEIGSLGDKGEPVITATMVNNYVKKKLVPAPVKKKYGRRQIATLIVVSILKRALSMPEISRVIALLQEAHGAEEGYDRFCDALEDTLRAAYSSDAFQMRPYGMDAQSLLDAALTAWIGKMLVRDQAAST